jgi:hypothetical protein
MKDNIPIFYFLFKKIFKFADVITSTKFKLC